MKDHYVNNYKNYAAPFFWWFKADQLLAAADIVFAGWTQAQKDYFSGMRGSGRIKLTEKQQKAFRFIHVQHIYLFLVGLAFENILKGIIIGRDSDKVSDDKINKELTPSHKNLIALFDKARISLDEKEKNLVERLGENVQWAGRYPIPKRANAMTLQPVPGMGLTMPGNFINTDPDTIKTILLRLKDVIDNNQRLPKYKSLDPDDEVGESKQN